MPRHEVDLFLIAAAAGEHRPRPGDRAFLAIWADGYSEETIKTELVGLPFFTDDNGYDNDSIRCIHMLGLGMSTNLTDPSGVHIITRVR